MPMMAAEYMIIINQKIVFRYVSSICSLVIPTEPASRESRWVAEESLLSYYSHYSIIHQREKLTSLIINDSEFHAHKISFYFLPLRALAFLPVITLLPVSDSICLRAFPAIVPPSRATVLFSAKFFGSRFFDISVVAVSANIFKTNSRFVILSRRFSFFRPFTFYILASSAPSRP